jgi:hypothetical protein
MNSLQAEWDRLYRAAAARARTDEGGLLHADGSVRALVLELARPADWDALSTLWRGVQTEFGLPAPGIAVSGVDGFQLWFSLAEAIPAAQAQDFLQALRQHYLPAVAHARLRLWPSVDGGQPAHAAPVPCQIGDSGHWSAFVAPDLVAIFVDEPWLDVSPSTEAQASVLARLHPIQAAAFTAACSRLRPVALVLAQHRAAAAPSHALAVAASADLDPRRFLQDVLNDPGVALDLRIAAAQALLP